MKEVGNQGWEPDESKGRRYMAAHKKSLLVTPPQENHLKFKLRSTINGKGKAIEGADVALLTHDVATTGIADVVQEDKTVCPICLDSCQDSGAVTVCGHVFCGDCIRDVRRWALISKLPCGFDCLHLSLLVIGRGNEGPQPQEGDSELKASGLVWGLRLFSFPNQK